MHNEVVTHLAIVALSHLSQVNQYFNKLLAERVAAAQPTEIPDDFYDKDSWHKQLLSQYAASQPLLPNEILLYPIDCIVDAMYHALCICSKSPESIDIFLQSVVAPLVNLEKFEKTIYNPICEKAGSDARSNKKFGESLWILKRIFSGNIPFIATLYKEPTSSAPSDALKSSFTSAENRISLHKIVYGHVHSILIALRKKIKLKDKDKKNFKLLADLDFHSNAITPFCFKCTYPNGSSSTQFSIGTPLQSYHPLQFQMAWLAKETQGFLDTHPMDIIKMVMNLAKDNQLSSLANILTYSLNEDLEENTLDKEMDIKKICQSSPFLNQISEKILTHYLALTKEDCIAQYLWGMIFSKGAGVEKDNLKAREYYQKSAQSGHPEAQFQFSLLSENIKLAQEYLMLAAAQGNRNAYWQLATAYDTSDEKRQSIQQIRREYELRTDAASQNLQGFMLCFFNLDHSLEIYNQARTLFLKASLANNAAAYFNLAHMYERGEGIGIDLTISQAHYLRSAELGNLYAQKKIAEAAFSNKDYAQAAIWYAKAADQGDADALDWMGVLYRDGKGVAIDKQREQDYFEKAALQGLAEAQNHLAVFHEKNHAYDQALAWYSEAALQSESSALFSLGTFFEKGLGVAQDYQRAALFYKKSSELGDTSAEISLAYLEEKGLLGQANVPEALKCYLAHAENGFVCYRLARLYEKGLGVAQDKEIADNWYKKVYAIAQGNPNGSNYYRLGLLHQYGNGGAQKNPELAQKFYQQALTANYCFFAAEIPLRLQELEYPG